MGVKSFEILGEREYMSLRGNRGISAIVNLRRMRVKSKQPENSPHRHSGLERNLFFPRVLSPHWLLRGNVRFNEGFVFPTAQIGIVPVKFIVFISFLLLSHRDCVRHSTVPDIQNIRNNTYTLFRRWNGDEPPEHAHQEEIGLLVGSGFWHPGNAKSGSRVLTHCCLYYNIPAITQHP